MPRSVFFVRAGTELWVKVWRHATHQYKQKALSLDYADAGLQMSASTRCQGTTRCCVLIQGINGVLKLDKHIKRVSVYLGWTAAWPPVGVTAACVLPVSHLYLLLGELSTSSRLSLTTNAPEDLQRRGAITCSADLKGRSAMMNLQQALEAIIFPDGAAISVFVGTFIMRILLRLRDDNGDVISGQFFTRGA